MSVPQVVVVQQEPHGNWRCCCGCCHVTTGAKIIGWSEVVAISLLLLMFTASLVKGGLPPFQNTFTKIELAVCLAYFACACMLLRGVQKHIHGLLIPWLAVNIISFSTYLLLFVIIVGAGVFVCFKKGRRVFEATVRAIYGCETSWADDGPDEMRVVTARQDLQPGWMMNMTERGLQVYVDQKRLCRNFESRSPTVTLLAAGVPVLIGLVFAGWFLSVVCRSYKYIKALARVQPVPYYVVGDGQDGVGKEGKNERAAPPETPPPAYAPPNAPPYLAQTGARDVTANGYNTADRPNGAEGHQNEQGPSNGQNGHQNGPAPGGGRDGGYESRPPSYKTAARRASNNAAGSKGPTAPEGGPAPDPYGNATAPGSNNGSAKTRMYPTLSRME